ncbi:MAG: hypothetical protein LBV50_12705 [Novosphingobium sp.]|jgi:hypothetical protein|nr:hypothetical protein [Novosphingobium sp.]
MIDKPCRRIRSGNKAGPFALVLLLALPLAALGSFLPAQAYQGLGMRWSDCEGPDRVLMFALPALALYAAGAIANGLRYRRLPRLVAAVLCLAVCVPLALNALDAMKEGAANSLVPACW